MKLGRHRLRQEGFGIVEALIAAAVVIILSLVLAGYITRATSASAVLRNRSVCSDFASSLVQNIRSHSNNLNIRTWLPATSGTRKGPPSPADPFCNGDSERAALCDSVDMWSDSNPNNMYLSENVRNSATWAMNVYNYYNTGGEICQGRGIVVPKADADRIGKLFPSVVDFPNWIEEAALKIEVFKTGPAGNQKQPCTPLDVRTKMKDPEKHQFQITVELKYKLASTDPDGEPELQSCAADTTVGYDSDSVPPTLSVGVVNLNNEVVPQGTANIEDRCTCRTSWDPGACDERKGVTVSMAANEPGVLFMCKRTQPAALADLDYIYCGDIPGGMQMTDGAGNVTGLTMNQPTRAKFTYTNLPDNTIHDMSVIAIDVAGNVSPVSRVTFYVHKPYCPTTNVCPNDVPGPGQGPNDGCGRDCPVGILTPTCPNPGTFCGPTENSCGTGPCAPGTNCNPNTNPCLPACSDFNLNDYCVGQQVFNGCGGSCGEGTKVAGCGGTEPDVTPTAAPFCSPPPKGFVTTDASKCCGQGIYYCKEHTAKWIKDWAKDQFCCVHEGCPMAPGPREDLDDMYRPNIGACLHACWASDRPRSRCWQINKVVCLGPGSQNLMVSGANCKNMQALCGISGHWFDDLDGGGSILNWATFCTAIDNLP